MSEDQIIQSLDAGAVHDTRIDEDGFNNFTLTCNYCPSKILRPKVGSIVRDLERQLPKMTQDKLKEKIEMDLITEWFIVKDIYAFENAGFSNSIDNVKYLTCSDCEFGPIGFFEPSTNISYVALSRVKHEN